MGKILRVTMEDVAKAAGVTQATVSLALRKHPAISEATRERVRQAAARLGYQQHGAISTMMARVRLRRPVRYQATLGALIAWADRKSWQDNATFRRYMSGATERASELGFRLDEFWPVAEGVSSDRLRQILHARRVEGLVLMPIPRQGALPFDLSDFAAAAIGYTIQEPPIHRAITAHYEEMLVTLRQLRARGYRRVAAVVDREVNERIERKWSGAFLAEQPQRGAVLSLAPSDPDSRGRFSRWLRRVEPDALIVCNLPVSDWLRELGLRVPQDLGVALLGERFQEKGFARIDERSDRVGAAAVELVIAQLHRNERGLPPFPQAIHIEGVWEDGGSLRPC